MQSVARRVLDLVGLILVSIIFPVNLVISTIGTNQLGLNNSIDSNRFQGTEINPAAWTFAIWGVIYIWQLIWIVYAWTFVCRPNAERTIFTGVYYGIVIINIVSLAWVVVWGYAHVSGSAAILILWNIIFYPIIASEAIFLRRANAEVKGYDLWLTRILLLNGLVVYVTWTTIASLLNLTIAVQYDGGASPSTAAYISLGLLTGTAVTYFLLENTVLNRYFRYVFAVYPVTIWALCGILANEWDKDDVTGPNIFTLVLLSVVVILAVVRIILFILFTIFHPIKPKIYTEA